MRASHFGRESSVRQSFGCASLRCRSNIFGVPQLLAPFHQIRFILNPHVLQGRSNETVSSDTRQLETTVLAAGKSGALFLFLWTAR